MVTARADRPRSADRHSAGRAGVQIAAQTLHAVADELVEQLLRDLFIGPLPAREAARVRAPAPGTPVLVGDVEVLLSLGLDDQTGVVRQSHDKIGVVVA